MTLPIYAAGIAVLAYFLYKLLYGTDTPHIKGLPEVPGLPLFGSLYELGTCHAKVAQGWAKKTCTGWAQKRWGLWVHSVVQKGAS
ncbi:uncharacterized protein SETTUDRAFT_23171 [Exserohilum turcica Et28A]|uniref:Uncharacterized protein n=1 Tax=Exserohilum turcicum (strain 28A) TaxID=671987 RepID=R0I940_EXST2|nr:uncharacterized protein SETTUDRAFT_23171 [Exserohilum turcica Et28A]EOA81911.1 hypothetical protein SETTUDRAFT_23171 [Exserohilum turcica Et28A]